MTSPSLRSRPITRPSTGRRIEASSCRGTLVAWRAAGLAVCVLLIADATRAEDFNAPEPPDFTAPQAAGDFRSNAVNSFRPRAAAPMPKEMETTEAPPRVERSARRAAVSRVLPQVSRGTRTEPAVIPSAPEAPMPQTGRAAIARVSQAPAAAPDQNPATPPAPTGRDPFKADVPYTPGALKRVCEILPYADYEPDPHVAATDPCKNQCPRPGSCPPGERTLCPQELWTPGEFYPRMFEPSCFTWAATNLWYNPLYFEDVALERYGHSYCCAVQPFVSVGRFGAQVVTLPYHMGIDPPCKKEYALGYYRPGDCAPKLCYQPPLSARGALVEAGVLTGLFFAIP